MSSQLHYRKLPPEDKTWIFAAELVGGFTWWWILWHLWHDFGHIVVSIRLTVPGFHNYLVYLFILFITYSIHFIYYI